VYFDSRDNREGGDSRSSLWLRPNVDPKLFWKPKT
jgi:hypothetical protein